MLLLLTTYLEFLDFNEAWKFWTFLTYSTISASSSDSALDLIEVAFNSSESGGEGILDSIFSFQKRTDWWKKSEWGQIYKIGLNENVKFWVRDW
jgi:hypothetical protein